MYARKVMPVYSATRTHGRASAMRPFSFFLGASRSRRRRFFLVLLGATALAAIGASLIPRLTQSPTPALSGGPPGPAEPGLFEFPQARQTVPVPPAPEPQTPLAKDAAAAKPQPLPRPAPMPATVQLPGGVERFDSCAPACDSRDPALGAPRTASTPVPVRPMGDVPRPPKGVGEGVLPRSEPGLMERTWTATGEALSGTADFVKGMVGIK